MSIKKALITVKKSVVCLKLVNSGIRKNIAQNRWSSHDFKFFYLSTISAKNPGFADDSRHNSYFLFT